MPSLASACHATSWRRVMCLALAAVLLGAGGCGGKAAKKGKKAGGGAAESEAAPPAIDPDTAFTVDEGRISVASPTGWTRAERSKDYLVKYQTSRKKAFPAIVVTGDDPPEGFATVTPENHAEFVAAITDGLADAFTQKAGGSRVKTPAAQQLGPHLGAAWALPAPAQASGSSKTIEQQFYAVVVAGRMYTIVARAPKGDLDAATKAAARAVAGALRPPEPEAADAPAE